jgi:hypothetical protein
MLGPVLAGTVRLVLVAGAGAWLVASDAPAWQLFALVSAGMVVYGLATVASIRFTPWRSREPARGVSREPARAQTGSLAAHAPSPSQPHS